MTIKKHKNVFHLNYLVAKAFKENNLKFTDEVMSFLQVCEPIALEHFPTDVLSNDFRYLLQSMLFTKEYLDR